MKAVNTWRIWLIGTMIVGCFIHAAPCQDTLAVAKMMGFYLRPLAAVDARKEIQLGFSSAPINATTSLDIGIGIRYFTKDNSNNHPFKNESFLGRKTESCDEGSFLFIIPYNNCKDFFEDELTTKTDRYLKNNAFLNLTFKFRYDLGAPNLNSFIAVGGSVGKRTFWEYEHIEGNQKRSSKLISVDPFTNILGYGVIKTYEYDAYQIEWLTKEFKKENYLTLYSGLGVGYFIRPTLVVDMYAMLYYGRRPNVHQIVNSKRFRFDANIQLTKYF